MSILACASYFGNLNYKMYEIEGSIECHPGYHEKCYLHAGSVHQHLFPTLTGRDVFCIISQEAQTQKCSKGFVLLFYMIPSDFLLLDAGLWY